MGQEVIQIEPNSAWTIPYVPKVQNKKILAIACQGKTLVFQMEIRDYFKLIILKIGLFHRVKELFKSNQTRYGVSHGYLE